MRNFYNCGCYVSGDVPVLTRCALHNGWVVARTDCTVNQPRLFRQGRVKVVHDNLLSSLPRLKRKYDLVFSYPEYELLAFAHQLTDLGFARSRMEFFSELTRLLGVDGKAILVLDPDQVAMALYQLRLLGFRPHLRYVPVRIVPEPMKKYKLEQTKYYKVMVGVRTGPLPKFRLASLDSFLTSVGVAENATILDTSGMWMEQLVEARPKSNIIGIVENVSRYRRIVASNVVGADPS